MKKRILSFILVACMLLTMLPIMASAEEATEVVASNVESTNADYAKLYEQTGLVHAYMAFGIGDTSYDVTNGVWYDLIGSANASFTGGAYSASNPTGWQVGPYGGAMYVDNDAFRATGQSVTWKLGTGEGQLNLPETYTVEYLSRNELRDVPVAWSNSNLTSAAVADSTDTLYTASIAKWNAGYGKYVITFKGTAGTKYAAKINGSAATITIGADGTYLYSGTVPTGKTEFQIQTAAGMTVEAVKYTASGNEFGSDQAFAFGNLRALAWTNTVGSNGWGNGFGSVRWFAAAKGWTGNGYNCVTLAGEDRNLANHDGKTMPITVFKTNMEVADVGVSEKYVLSLGTKSYGTASYTYTPDATNSVKNGNSGAGLLSNATAAFRVQACLPGVVYSLRMYNCEISDATKKLNHFVDIMAYVRYDIAKYEALSAETKTALINAYADVDLENVRAGHIDSTIARIEGTLTAEETLYVQDGLVALYLPENADIANKVWYNAVAGGANATMNGKFYYNADGSIRVNGQIWGSETPSGGFDKNWVAGTKLSNNFDQTGTYLNIGYENLPKGDVSVSTTIKPLELLSMNVETGKFTNGRLGKTGLNDSAWVYSEVFRLQIGWFGTFLHLGKSVGVFGNSRWAYAQNANWQNTGDWGSTMGNNRTEWRTYNNKVVNETIIRNEADDKKSATFSLVYDGATVKSGTYDDQRAKSPYTVDEANGQFFLFRAWPVDVYSVAVYDKVLSATEIQRNHAADLVEYYDIDASFLLAEGSEGLLTAFISASQSIKIDPDNYLENKKLLEELVVPKGEMNDYDKLYVQDGLTALYTAYDLDDKSIDYANGLWYNKLGDTAEQGAVAVLRGPKYAYDAAVETSWGWAKGENGGFHVSITKAIYDKYIGGKTTEGGTYTGIVFDKGLINGEKYTVEVVLETEYLLTASGDPYLTTTTTNQYGVYNNYGAVYRLGDWNATAFIAKGHSGGSFGQDRWFYYDNVYQSHNGNGTFGGVTGKYRTNMGLDDIYSMSIYQEKVAVETEAKYASSFSVAYDIDASKISAVSSKYLEPKYGEFSLLNGIGGAIYAVRTYNRALSIAEMEQNHFADLAAYLEIDLTEFNKLDDDQKTQVYTEFANTRLSGASKANVEAYIAILSGGMLADTLYVTEGLVGMFSAFAADDGAFINLGDKNWINLVDPEVNATITGNTWKMNADGSFGYDMNWGTAVPKTDYFGKVWYDRDSSTSNHSMDSHYVNFGIALLPKDNFTVEWVSKYDEVGLTLADGSQVSYLLSTINKYYYTKTEIATGNKTGIVSDTALTDDATYTYTLLGYGYAAQNSCINPNLGDAIGYLKTFASVGGRFEGNTNYCYRWYTTDGNGGWGASGYTSPAGSNNIWEDKGGVYSTIPGEIQTKTVTRTKNYESDVLTSVKYDILRNGALTSSATYPVEAKHTPGKSYPLGAESVFYLFKGQPVDLYAVRIYDHVLTTEEQIQNRAADIVKFYDVDLTKFYQCTAIEQAEILSELADLGFDSTKEQAQKIADYVPVVEANGMTQYDEAYVQDGLVGLYTAYALNETSLSILGGTWANKVEGGEAATVVGTGYWFRGENGGLGYHLTLAQYESFARTGNQGMVGISLPESFADLNAFTVESVAKTYGVTNKDGTPYYNVYSKAYTDANGIEVPASGATYGYFGTYSAGYRFGLLNSCSWSVQYPGNENSLGNNRWFVSPYRYGHHNYGSNTSIYQLVKQEKILQNYNLEAITFQVSKTTAESGDVTYKIGANGAAPVVNETITAAKIAELKALDPTVAPDKSGNFSLYNNIPSMVYAVRVYNRELTQAEQYQNHFVDIAAFYGLDLSLMKDEDKELLYASFEDITFAADADYVKALYAFLTGDKLAMADTIAEHAGYEPLLENEEGYRVLFGIDEDVLARFIDAGYEVTYGAVVGIGDYGSATVNTVDGLTVTCDAKGNIALGANITNAQVVVVGTNGSGQFYDVMLDKSIYSVAVTADPAQYSAGVIVRGFVSFLDAAGESTIVYLDPAEDAALSGAVSVLEAADYYVNEYEENVAEAYRYMGNFMLCNILKTCGIPTRTTIDGELTLYVDVNGSDENNGLTEDKPLATVEAAYAAAKAHLTSKYAKGVTISLGEGEFDVKSVLTLKGENIAAEDYYVNIEGKGAGTILNGAVDIDMSKAVLDTETMIYQVYVPGAPNFRYLYVDGEIFQNVHLGDEENYYTFGEPVVVDRVTDKDGKVTTEGSAMFYMPANLFDGVSTYENTEIHTTVEWNFNIIHIDHVDYANKDANGNVAVYVNYDQFKNMAIYNTITGRQYWLENSLDLLNEHSADLKTEKCFYYEEDTGILYIYVDEDTTFINGKQFSYAGIENMFVFEDVTGLTVRDLTITGVDNRYVTDESGLKGGQAGSNGRIVNNDTGNAVTESKGFLTLAAIYGNNISNAIFSGLTIKNVAGDGLSLRGIVRDVEILSNEFLHIGETAIRVGNSNRGEATSTYYNMNVTIADNYINGTGEYFKQCCGMLITNGANVKVVGNTITNTTYTAISIGWKWNESDLSLEDIRKNNRFHLYNVEVAYNYITNFMTCMRDGGGIYILGGNAANDVATYFNYMHDNYMVVTEASGNHVTPKWFMGYYHDGAGSNWHDYNNVVVNATTTGVGNFVPYYVQQINGQKSHNVKLEGNYALGFTSATALYGNTERIDASRNIIANDYIFSDVAMNTPVVGSKCGDAVSVAAPSNAKALVANIYTTAGSSLAPADVKLTGGVSVAGGVANDKSYESNGAIINGSDMTNGLTAPTFAVNLIVDGAIVKTYNVSAGETFTIDYADPTKAADVQYTYTFAGWEGYEAGMKVYANMDIEAVFDKTVNEYKVTFMNGDGVFYEVDVPYGTPVADVIAGMDIPTKEADKVNTYAFGAWFDKPDSSTGSPAIKDTVVGAKTYYATYSPTPIYYKWTLVVFNPETGEYDQLYNSQVTYNRETQVNGPLNPWTYWVGDYETEEHKATVDEFVAQYMPQNENIRYEYNMTTVVKEGAGKLWYLAHNYKEAYQMWHIQVTEQNTVFELVFDESEYRVNVNGEDLWYAKGATIDFTTLDSDKEIESITVNGEVLDPANYAAYVVDTAGAQIVINYVAEAEYAIGDVDGSGTINAIDAGWIYEIIAGTRDASTVFGAADLDGSGTINAIDAGWIYEIIAGTRDGKTLEPIA